MKKNKLYLAGVIFIIFSLICFGYVEKSFAEKPIILKYAAYWPLECPNGLVTNWWMNEIEKRTNGRVKWERYWAQSLVKAADGLKAVSSGISDANIVSVGYGPSDLPLSTALELPLIVPKGSIWVHMKLAEELYNSHPAFQKEWNKFNVKVIGLNPVPTGLIITKGKQVKTLEDLKNLKLRSYGYIGRTLNKMGAVSVSMPAPEMYTAIQRGTVDGAHFVLASIESFKLHEVSKYITVNTGLEVYACLVDVMNLKTWNKLPTEIQKIIEDINREWVENATRIWMEEEKKAVKFLIEKGLIFYKLPKEEKARWAAASRPTEFYDEWIKEKAKLGLPSADYLNEVQGLVKKFEGMDEYYKMPKFD